MAGSSRSLRNSSDSFSCLCFVGMSGDLGKGGVGALLCIFGGRRRGGVGVVALSNEGGVLTDSSGHSIRATDREQRQGGPNTTNKTKRRIIAL